ncbi:MAG TPA: hemerythrin domain-containing protein [Gallionellaceae bacterium]|nr:hemerythrin domain-containing protein [Gallionellaceae bacterium]
MQTLTEFMTADHKACDDRFALAEQPAYANNWNGADTAFNAFRAAMTHHFHLEEHILFPALLAAGGPGAPVQMMTMEHAQMNSLLDNMAAALARKEATGYSGLSETLLIVLQQHNLKEEQILYPIAERLLAGSWDTLHSRMQSVQQEYQH